MVKFVALTLLTVHVTVTAGWNSTDERHKEAADKEKSARLISQLGPIRRTLESLKNYSDLNRTILDIQNRNLEEEKQRYAYLNKTVMRQKSVVDSITEKQGSDRAVLAASTAKLRNVTASAKDCEGALEAATSECAARSAEVDKAAQALSHAIQHFDDAVSSPSKILTAENEREAKENALKAARAALQHAENNKAAKAKALNEAMLLVQNASIENAKANTTFNADTAKLTIESLLLSQMTAQIAHVSVLVENLTKAAAEQASLVGILDSNCSFWRRELESKQAQLAKLEHTFKDDSACVQNLREKREQVHDANAWFNRILLAYHSTPSSPELYRATWLARDKLDSALFDLYLVQKDCAPEGSLGRVSPPETCEADTGGTCSFLFCWPSRHATCGDDHRCTCPVGTCAKDGACVSRGQPDHGLPTVPKRPETEMETQAVISSGFAPLVFMSAVLIGVIAAVAMKKQRASRVVTLPVDAFG
jgi:hypothetical protein